MDKTTRHLGLRRLAGWLKTLAIALGLTVVGYVAVTMNDHRAPRLHAFAAAAVRGADAPAMIPTALHGERLATSKQVSVDPTDEIDSSKSEPRSADRTRASSTTALSSDVADLRELASSTGNE